MPEDVQGREKMIKTPVSCSELGGNNPGPSNFEIKINTWACPKWRWHNTMQSKRPKAIDVSCMFPLGVLASFGSRKQQSSDHIKDKRVAVEVIKCVSRVAL